MSKTAHMFCWFVGSFFVAFVFIFGMAMIAECTPGPSAFLGSVASAVFACFWGDHAERNYTP